MNTSARILIVEDEPKLAALLRDYLQADGHTVDWLDRGDGVIDWLRLQPAELLILDLMLPGRDGFEVCRELRRLESSAPVSKPAHLPVIMLTARIEEIDRLLGLELGADDYVCKPFSPRELVARVRALLRRSRDWAQAPCPIEARRLRLDEASFVASYEQTRLDLTPVEFRLLKALSQRPGAVMSRTQLLDCLYLDHRVVSDRTVDSHIKNLRRKLDEVAPGGELVESVYGVGYRYCGD